MSSGKRRGGDTGDPVRTFHRIPRHGRGADVRRPSRSAPPPRPLHQRRAETGRGVAARRSDGRPVPQLEDASVAHERGKKKIIELIKLT